MSILLFTHIPKTAGTTLNVVLRRYYSSKATYKIHAGENAWVQRAEAFATMPAAQQHRFRLIRGHWPFGLHAQIDGPSTYITILRDPVERVVSLFHHIRETPRHHAYRHGFSLAMPLLEFVKSDLLRNNEQTWFLTGKDVSEHGAEVALAEALGNVAKHYAVVGLTERFDESLLLMRKALGWSTPPVYVRRRVNGVRLRGDGVAAEVREAIEARNTVDLLLYQQIRDTFEATVAGQGPAFQRALRRFRYVNALYRQYHRVRGPRTPRAPRVS